MQCKILGFHLDEYDDWIAELECHHGQHVRHNPPFINRSWVMSQKGRNNKLGQLLECLKCERNEPIDTW